MASSEENSESSLLKPRLQGFPELIISDFEPDKRGLPSGTTLLISGPPGAGKTTFALSLARSLMREGPEGLGQTETRPKPEDRMLYFISSEINRVRLKAMFSPLGWFPLQDKAGKPKEKPLFQVDQGPDVDRFYIIVPEPATDRPVPTPEELVNGVFNRIAKSLSPGESKAEGREVIVVVDSITALLKGCASPGDERRQTHEILHRLRALFSKKHLVLTILLAEQDFASQQDSHAASVEDYLTDIVFRLYHKRLPLGRRGRVLEIVKSQGVDMIPGEHSWEIITDANHTRFFRHEKFAGKVKALGNLDGPDHWGTVAIFPRPRVLHESLAPKTDTKPIPSGTFGLDEMLLRTPEHWLPRPMHTGRPPCAKPSGLCQGSTTLVAGPLGTGKTTLCMQFLLHEALQHFLELPKGATSGKPPRRPRRGPAPNVKKKIDEPPSLLVCLNVDAQSVVQAAWKAIGDLHPAAKEKEKFWIAVLDFTQSHFDFNHLMAHLDWALTHFEPKRIAFDGISEWLAMFDRPDASKMLEAISVVIANHPSCTGEGRPTVFMTYEMATEDDPLAPQALGVSAENIIALKQINIQDEIRKVIYVLKSESSGHDPTVRELAYENGRFHVRSGLDSFNGLLRGRTEPAEVLLQLFRENHGEMIFNRWLVRRLERLSHLRFKALDFSRSEIGRLLEDTSSQTRFPAADLKLLSVDEWWLNSLPKAIPAAKKKKAGIPADQRSPLLNLKEMWDTSPEGNQTREETALAPSWRDFWIFEVEKSGPAEDDKLRPGGGQECRYAVPGYMDYGMFCVNIGMIEEMAPDGDACHPLAQWIMDEQERKEVDAQLKEFIQARLLWKSAKLAGAPGSDGLDPEALAKGWSALLRSVPRSWVKMKAGSTKAGLRPLWFEGEVGSKESDPTIVGLLKTLQKSWGARTGTAKSRWGFAFDTATRETVVCTFFELAWAFGADEEFLQRAKHGEGPSRETAGITAIKFLQFLVLEGLMPARPTVDTTRNSLFCRHFYSTLRSAADLDRWDEQGGKKDDEVSAPLLATGTATDLETTVPPPPPPSLPRLMALPFFPSGVEIRDGKLKESLQRDIRIRLERLVKRWADAGKGTSFAEAMPADRPADMAKNIRALCGFTEGLVAKLQIARFAEEAEPGMTVGTPADIIELAHWHMLRMRLLAGGASLPDILNGQDGYEKQPFYTPSKMKESVPTGYGCTGSWMYGVHEATRSPSLARDLLQEITSLDAAEERARRGAGIPPRKDFFELHGHRPVPGMEYLTWRKLLRYCGARARRRERVLPSHVKPAKVYQVIQNEVLACLALAELCVHDYAGTSGKRDKVIEKMHTAATEAFIRIREEALKPPPSPPDHQPSAAPPAQPDPAAPSSPQAT